MICDVTGKQSHSRDEARRKVREIADPTNRLADRAEDLEIYRCEYCGRWHLGHGHNTIKRRKNLVS